MNPFRRIRQFSGETTQELKKSAWPTATELRDSTVVVLVATLLMGGFVALADFSVYSWVDFLTKVVR